MKMDIFVFLLAIIRTSFSVMGVILPQNQNAILHQRAFTATKVEVNVRTDVTIHVTDERYLSVALDVATFDHHSDILNFSSPKLQVLTRALSPAFLRLSGTSTDFLTFKNPCHEKVQPDVPTDTDRPESYMCPENWDAVNNFCVDTGMRLIFGLNMLFRTDDGRWNSSNAVSLLDYNTYDVAWELGNEPSMFKELANVSISGCQVGEDFNSLREILQSRPRYAGAAVYGPDVIGGNSPQRIGFLKGFLSHATSINATTFHSYYLNGAKATLSDFLDPYTLDRFLPTLIELERSLATEYYGEGAKVWLGETGNAYGSGAKNLSDRFAAGFLYLDKLGMSAKMGIDVVIQQAVYGGAYTMLDIENLDPKPDYWIAFIYKYLVGPKVLQADTETISHRKDKVNGTADDKNYVRVYAHCTATSKSGYSAGAVTLLALNMNQTDSASITLLGQVQQQAVDQYLLTYGKDGVTSSQALLNNQLLHLVNNTILPTVKPVPIVSGKPIIMPPLSYGFFVIPKANAKACVD